MASVYLEVSRDRGGAPHEVRLRWQALATQLSEQGAGDKTVDVAGVVATEVRSQPGAAGRAIFAADGRVLHDIDLPKPPRRELARWAMLQGRWRRRGPLQYPAPDRGGVVPQRPYVRGRRRPCSVPATC